MNPDPIDKFLLGTDVIGDIRRQILRGFDVVTCIPRLREFPFAYGFGDRNAWVTVSTHR